MISSLALVLCLGAAAQAARLAHAPPEAVGMRSQTLEEIDDAVAKALAARQMPGCVVLVARSGKIVFLRSYGDRALQPAKLPMATDTVFDLASLTKPVVTTTSMMLLVEEGKVALNEPVARYLPEFAANGKESITVRQLLTHEGGLIADNPLDDFAAGREQAVSRLLAITPQARPGETFVYSDVGFMVLGELVERVADEDLSRFSTKKIFQPLGMGETGFLPAETLRERAAPTEQRESRWMQGEVHDPRAYALGGVAGNAGLFSTAEDLAVYAQMLLDGGAWDGRRVLKPQTVADMTLPHKTVRGIRALGWDMRSGYSSNRGDGFSDRAFGHGGFTGTSLWIDPELKLTVIFLSNRVHPDGRGSVNRLAGSIGTIAANAIEPTDEAVAPDK